MYTNHFSMTDTPFQEQPTISRLICHDSFDRQLARLRHFSEQGRIALLTGRTGVGKTSLIRLLMEQLEPRLVYPVMVQTSRMGATALLRQVLCKLGERPTRGREKLFAQLNDKAIALGRTILLIIDESHLPEPESLIDLRLLADTSRDNGSPLFRILLSGQDELLRFIKQDRFTDLRERICIRATLYPLDAKGTSLYIASQLKSVGSDEKIFLPTTIVMIYDYSGGVPRRINNAATACLMAAASKKTKLIDEKICRHALEELL